MKTTITKNFIINSAKFNNNSTTLSTFNPKHRKKLPTTATTTLTPTTTSTQKKNDLLRYKKKYTGKTKNTFTTSAMATNKSHKTHTLQQICEKFKIKPTNMKAHFNTLTEVHVEGSHGGGMIHLPEHNNQTTYHKP